MDMGGNRPCRRRVEIRSIDVEGNIRCRRRRRDVIRRDISCLSTDIISTVRLLVSKGFEELVGKHNKRAFAVLFLALEVISFLLDACGKTQRSFLLAALILSAFACVLTTFTCLIKKSNISTTPDAERQLEVVEFSFSLIQLIVTCLAVFSVKIITKYNASVLLLLFAIIAVVFIFRKNENGADMSMSSSLANNISSLVYLEFSEVDGFSDWEPITGFPESCLLRSFRESIASHARLTALELRFSEMKLTPLEFSCLDVIQKVESLHLRRTNYPGYIVPISLNGPASTCVHLPAIYRLEWNGTFTKLRFICQDSLDQDATYWKKISNKLLKGCNSKYNKYCTLLFNYPHRFKNIGKELPTAVSELNRKLELSAPNRIVDAFWDVETDVIGIGQIT